ncbi:cation:proton antiporter [Halioxenophilus aromaticivorans]|uniref:cation:proton antiporter n=1 Tax=Halioxenophilus aromaticivorans TaxID=1306992 RepID=UPI0031E70DA3
MNESIPLMLALIGLIGFACQWIAWRVRLPAILFLLAAGIIMGPFTGVLDPDALFGDLLFPLISLSVAVILFEGSLTLDFDEIRAQKGVVQRLVIIGAGVSWVLVALATHYLFGLSWELSVLFGALTVVTGPTVVVPMLRTVRPNAAIANILRWEGILIDPIGALFVVVVYEFIISQGQASGFSHSLVAFCKIIGVGSVLGIGGGAALSVVLKRFWVPEYLQNLATLSSVFVVFTVANALAHESGLLAVTLMGMWMANQKNLHISEILNFKEDLTVVLLSGLFILLAARLQLPEILALGFTPLVLLAVMQFVARPASVWASAVGSDLTWQEKSLLSWIAPRGIVAAAVSALFAIRLEDAGLEDAGVLVPLTFIIIVGTVVLQSATSRPIARWLGVSAKRPEGFIVVGANPIARRIAQALGKHKVRVLLTDSNYENIKNARMDGLETFYGDPLSDFAEQRLDLDGIGRLLALSPERNKNTVAGMHYRNEFGATKIYTVQTSAETKLSEKHQQGTEKRGYIAFNDELTYGKLASLLARGAEIRSTKMTQEFSFDDFKATNAGNVIPMFSVDPEGKVEVFVDEGHFVPEPGWNVISLFKEVESVEEAAKAKMAKKAEKAEKVEKAEKAEKAEKTEHTEQGDKPNP